MKANPSMRFINILIFPFILFLLLFFPRYTYSQLSSPADRQETNPLSITSEKNNNARPIPIEDLFFTRDAFGPTWSPDGKEIVFTSNLTGRDNLWKVSSSGGWPIQLTQSDDRQYNAVYSPDGKWIVFQQDKGGDELWDLYAVPSAGGDVINLTNTSDIREENPLWSPDGNTIAIAYKPKSSPIYDVALLDFKTKSIHNITNEKMSSFGWSPICWSRDGKYLFANRIDAGSTDADISQINITTGELENLTQHKGKTLYLCSSVSANGKTLLITTNEKNGYQNVALLDIPTKKLKFVTDTQWEAYAGSFSPDGKFFTYLINADGRTTVYIANIETGQPNKLNIPDGLNYPAGIPSAYSPGGDRLIISHESSTKPQDLWIYEVSKKRSYQLTFSALASLNTMPLPPSKIVHYKSFDGKMISAFLWIPYNLKRDSSNAALVLPHGGPTGQTVDSWNRKVSALASKGYICIAPNVRGSTGYGMDFQKANYKDLGGGDLQDELYAVKFLKSTGYVNPQKIGITGGSYGGFMTLMAIGKTPEVWGAGVELYGIVNWFTLYQHSDPSLDEYLISILGDPVKDSLNYASCSPLKYIHQVKCPLLVLQGDNDPRVPKEEAEQIVDILKNDGRTVAAHYYPNEGHGFAKRENQIDAIKRTIDWFDKYLMLR
jgi:dipeptidyl aminopeptidase/acylaminoacyl peptidase